jgi:phosphoserine phosphatase
MSRLVITSIGKDRPGIVANISKVLSENNVNILKTRASTLGDLFVMVMLVDILNMNIRPRELVTKLKRKGLELGSGISVEDATEYTKKKKLVAFDLDGTLIDMEIIDELAALAGVKKKAKEITRLAMNGKIDFKDSLIKRVSLLKGLKISDVEALKKKIQIAPGAQEFIRELKSAGFTTAIITGGFDTFAQYVGDVLGIDYIYANKLLVQRGRLTGKFKGKIISAQSKLDALKEIAKAEGLKLKECVAIGDGTTDLPILEHSGLGIGFKPKKPVKKRVNAILNKHLGIATAMVGVGQITKDVTKRIKS